MISRAGFSEKSYRGRCERTCVAKGNLAKRGKLGKGRSRMGVLGGKERGSGKGFGEGKGECTCAPAQSSKAVMPKLGFARREESGR